MTELDPVQAVIAEAKRYLGEVEQPKLSNRSLRIDYWLKEAGVPVGLPWCAAFVGQMGRQALGERWPCPRTAGVVVLADWAQQHGIQMLSPQVGDLFLIYEEPLKRFGHVGIVTSVAAGTPGRYGTIEGNTNPGGSRDGFGVFERDRPIDATTRYVRWVNLLGE